MVTDDKDDDYDGCDDRNFLCSQGPKFCLFFWKIGVSFSQHTQKLHGDILLQFNGNSMCNS